jgi:hypothetical protein
MYELNETEIEQISVDIERQGLTYTLLKNELLDHICCSIEEEMENGMTFNEAYRIVKMQIGGNRIRKIQDETLYLVNKKYRRMKKTMYVLGILIPILTGLGLVFKIQHWPGASALFTVGLISMSVVFLPVFAMVRIRDTRQQNEPVPLGFYITGMVAGILTILGSLMKLQHLPGAGVVITVGLASLALGVLPIYAVIKIRHARANDKPVNVANYVIGVIAGILFIAGTIFKSMHWPGAGTVLTISWIAVAVFLLPLLILNILKQEENRLNNFLIILLGFSFIAMLLLLQFR